MTREFLSHVIKICDVCFIELIKPTRKRMQLFLSSTMSSMQMCHLTRAICKIVMSIKLSSHEERVGREKEYVEGEQEVEEQRIRRRRERGRGRRRERSRRRSRRRRKKKHSSLACWLPSTYAFHIMVDT